VKVGRVDDALAAAGGLGVHGHFLAGSETQTCTPQTVTCTLSPIRRQGML